MEYSNNIDEQCINLVQHLFSDINDTFKDKNDKLSTKGSWSHIPVIFDLGIIPPETFFEISGYSDVTLKYQIEIIKYNNKDYYFREEVKPILYKLLKNIYNQYSLHDKCSEKFLEEKLYHWLIDAKEQNSITIFFSEYFEQKLNEAIDNYTIEFPVTNLHIQRKFSLGNVTFDFHTKNKYEEIWRKSGSNGEFEDFLKDYSNNIGRVFASYNVKAEKEKAKEIAFSECGNAMDVLKLFSPTVKWPEDSCLFELEKRINLNYSAEVISYNSNDLSSFAKNAQYNAKPFYITKEFLDEIEKYFFPVFTTFLLKKEKNELENLVQQSIELYSYAISTRDLHLRAVLLISVIESIFLEDDRTHKMKAKTSMRFSKIISKHTRLEYQRIFDALDETYSIRHKTIHKGRKLPIDLVTYKVVQVNIADLFRIIISKYSTCTNKVAFINSVDAISLDN